MFALTALEPLRKESRFRQTGSRISMQLKFRQAAGALASGSANWKMWDRKQVTPVSAEHPSPTPQGSQHEAHQRRQVIWEGRSFRTKSLPGGPAGILCFTLALLSYPNILLWKFSNVKRIWNIFTMNTRFPISQGPPSHSCPSICPLAIRQYILFLMHCRYQFTSS